MDVSRSWARPGRQADSRAMPTHAHTMLFQRTPCGIMWVIEDHLRPSGHIMPDHAGDRGAELLVLAPHDHLHINQMRAFLAHGGDGLLCSTVECSAGRPAIAGPPTSRCLLLRILSRCAATAPGGAGLGSAELDERLYVPALPRACPLCSYVQLMSPAVRALLERLLTGDRRWRRLSVIGAIVGGRNG